MPHHRRRHHTHRSPQLRQRHHHRPQNRLHHLHPIQLGALTTHHIHQRELRERRERPPALRHRPGEHRLPLQQLRSHTHPLRTLPRKDEHRRDPGTARAAHHVGVRVAGRQRLQGGCPVRSQHHRTVLQHRAAGGQPPRGVGRVRVVGDGYEPGGGLLEGGGALAGQDPGQDRECGPLRSALHRRPVGLGCAVLLQHHMRVGTTHTEGGHRGTTGLLPAGPLPRLPQQLDSTGGPVHMRRRLIHMQSPRHHPVPQRLHHLDHTTGTRRSLRMPDVRLDRPQPQRPLRRTILTIGVEQRLRLDRITQRRTRTVRLHHIDIRRR